MAGLGGGGVICGCNATGGAKSNRDLQYSQSECLAPSQLLPKCFHPHVSPMAGNKHRIISFYLPFRQSKWLRLNPPHDPHGRSTDMYTPSLLEHLRLK